MPTPQTESKAGGSHYNEDFNSKLSRRNTHRAKAQKEKNDEMAKKYKNISIFSWYTPENFIPKNQIRDSHAW